MNRRKVHWGKVLFFLFISYLAIGILVDVMRSEMPVPDSDRSFKALMSPNIRTYHALQEFYSGVVMQFVYSWTHDVDDQSRGMWTFLFFWQGSWIVFFFWLFYTLIFNRRYFE